MAELLRNKTRLVEAHRRTLGCCSVGCSTAWGETPVGRTCTLQYGASVAFDGVVVLIDAAATELALLAGGDGGGRFAEAACHEEVPSVVVTLIVPGVRFTASECSGRNTKRTGTWSDGQSATGRCGASSPHGLAGLCSV